MTRHALRNPAPLALRVPASRPRPQVPGPELDIGLSPQRHAVRPERTRHSRPLDDPATRNSAEPQISGVVRRDHVHLEHDRPFRHGGQDECRSKSRMRWSIDTANQRNGDRSYPQEVGEPGESVECRKEPYRIVLRHRRGSRDRGDTDHRACPTHPSREDGGPENDDSRPNHHDATQRAGDDIRVEVARDCEPRDVRRHSRAKECRADDERAGDGADGRRDDRACPRDPRPDRRRAFSVAKPLAQAGEEREIEEEERESSDGVADSVLASVFGEP